jgi:hypothetical protein
MIPESREELEVPVIEVRKTVLGQEHLVTLTSMANLALVFRSQGGWKEAEERVVEMKKKVLGQGV